MTDLVVRCQARTYDNRLIQVVVSESKKSATIDKDDYYTPFIQAAAKEVKQYPLITQRKIFQLLTAAQIGLSSLVVTTEAHAEERIQFPILEKAYELDILPSEIVNLLIQMIIGCGILAVAFAMLCFMIAGTYAMIGQVDKARTWSVNIIKGLGQVLVGPAIILLLTTLAGLIFRNVPGLDIFF